MDLPSKIDRTAVRKVKVKDSRSDFDFWQSQPYETRLATLESIRREYHEWKYGHQPGFQRVYSIAKLGELEKEQEDNR